MKLPNADIYVTGSNSRLLSSDIVTEFRDKGDEIHMLPLSFSEYINAENAEADTMLNEYLRYGGMPRILQFTSSEDKGKYLKDLFAKTYIKDVIERNSLSRSRTAIDDVLHVIASSVGSLTNPDRISNTMESVRHIKMGSERISGILGYLEDSYILSEAERYSIKGRKHIGAQRKYYFSDTGLRNACLSFRQMAETHLMENTIYNELIYRGFSVNVGTVEYNWKNIDGKSQRSQLEVDFIAERGDEKYYIQSAFMIPDKSRMDQETNSLRRIRDSFRKIVVVRDHIIPWHDESGILFIGLRQHPLG